ncbi:MAG TPA: hypothetical protein PLU24_01450, partial [Candidatus Omnitrophota bacterium]|nr:hypothetical protein [Candidatus Omnitrophota bacterium]
QQAIDKLVEISMVADSDTNRYFTRILNYYSMPSKGRRDGNILYFDNGLVVNLDNEHAFVSSDNASKRGVVKSLISLDEKTGELKVTGQKDPVLSYSALIIKKEGGYESILLDEDYAKSMLVRLYFFKGEGLKHFKLFDEHDDKKGSSIYTYKVVW